MSLIRIPLPPASPDHEHQQACVAFINWIKERNGIELHPYNLDEWGRGAESTLIQSNRSAQHQRVSDSDRTALTHLVWNILAKVDPTDFDCAFFALAFAVRVQHLPYMTFGRTQKFINMLCKYAYCYYWSGADDSWNKGNAWVEVLSPCFHVPVDAVVLHNLRKENPRWFSKLITTPIVQEERKYARVKHGDQAVGWSNLDRTYPYIAVQQYVLDNLRGAITPIHREMRDLWH